MKSKWKQVLEPRLSFKFKDGHKIRLWVLDVGEYAHLMGERRDFQFYAEKDASLIYEEISISGHHATEHHLQNVGTWEWIGKWMAAGFIASDLMDKPQTELVGGAQ